MNEDLAQCITIAAVAVCIMRTVLGMVSCQKDAEKELTKRQIIAGGTNEVLRRNDLGILLPQ